MKVKQVLWIAAAALIFFAEAAFATVTISALCTNQTPVPGSKGDFQSFSYPRMDSDYVIFSGYDGAGNQGLYAVSQESKGVSIVAQSSADFLGYGMASISSSTAFSVANLKTNSEEGFVSAKVGSNSPSIIASTSTAIPTGKYGNFVSFSSASSAKSGSIFAGSGSSFTGIFYVPVGKTDLVGIANTTTPIPSGSGNFNCLSSARVTDSSDEDIVFFGSQCSSTSSFVAAANMIVTRKATIHTLNAKHIQPGLYSYSMKCSKFYALVSQANVLPTSKLVGSGSETFTAFSSPTTSASLVAFIGLGSKSTMGVYTVSLNGCTTSAADASSIRVIADTSTEIPAGTGTFADFPEAPSVDGATVAFYGVDSLGNGGIYANIGAGGALFKVVDSSDKINGEAIVYLGFADNSLITTANADGTTDYVFVFYAVLGDKSLGIFTATVSGSQPAVRLSPKWI